MIVLQQVAEKIIVIAQVIAVIAKSLPAQKIAPKRPNFHLHAFISRKSANQLQYSCYPLAVVLHIIRSTAAEASQ
jgi:hypothetical protein